MIFKYLKVKPKYFDRHLVAGCSKGHKGPAISMYKKRNEKNSNYTLIVFFDKDGFCHFCYASLNVCFQVTA